MAKCAGKIGKGTIRNRHPDTGTTQVFFQMGENFGCCFRGSGCCWNNTVCCSSSPPQVVVRRINQVLVAGIGMYGGDKSLFNTPQIIEHFYHGCHTIGGAGCIGDDYIVFINNLIVNPQHHIFYIVVIGFGRG
jgi:hypothetical protein